MVTLTADVTEGVKRMTRKLIKTGLYKSQSEVVRDAIRQLAYKYSAETALSIEEIRRIVKKTRKTGKSMSDLVRKVRDE
ncbi:hypothetical protein HYX10_00900 [Candidatus Woesearchaeota archaeon]|nr:hypothetical protein [Candidatus Woesearchaeota archaeon]